MANTKKVTKKKTKRKTKKALSNEPVTISEFRSWLSGVIEFQESDWTPNEQQWGAILNKINNLVDDNHVTSAVADNQASHQPQQNTSQQAHVPANKDPNAGNHRVSVLNQSKQQAPAAPMPLGKKVVQGSPGAGGTVHASTMAPIETENGEQISSFS